MPFAIGLLAILALRTAAIGSVRTLIDLVVITGYVTLFAFARFVYRLYSFGHDLDPRAAFQIEPFMPAVLGAKQVANFTTASMPAAGTILMATFATGIAIVTAWHLVVGYRSAWKPSARMATRSTLPPIEGTVRRPYA
jgi:hypothetical protein